MKNLSLLAASTLTLIALAACASHSSNDESGAATGEDAVTSKPPPAPLPADYTRMSAAEKQDLLWDAHLVPTKYGSLPAWPSVDLIGIARLDLSVTLNRNSDEMPASRKKLVHALGSCAKVELIADADSPYTGMFQGGIGVARFSLATAPATNNFTPGLAVKMLIDGMPSQNLEVMYSIDGQGTDFDFFANRFSNIIAAPTGVGTNIIGDIFKKATPFPNYLDLDNFARHDRTGAEAPRFKAPHQVFFLPSSDVRAVSRASTPTVDFRVDLARIPADTTVYEIVAAENATSPWVHIGKLVTRSEIVASRYGDENLFFKHEEATKAP
jgi:hypothetical protein